MALDRSHALNLDRLCVLAKPAGGNITAANYQLRVQVWLWGQGSSKPERKGDRFLNVKVTLKDWNWITSSKATDSCRQQIARDLEVGWTPLPTHARPIFVSLPARPLSDTVVQSSGHIGSGGEQMKGPVFARWAPLAAIPPRNSAHESGTAAL